MTVKVTIETRQGYTDMVPFRTMNSAEYFVSCIENKRHPNEFWSTHERSIRGIDITRVISVEEEN